MKDETFRKVYIRSEEDLPKENGTYFVKIKTPPFTQELSAVGFIWADDRSSLNGFWLNKVDWYLQPIEQEQPSKIQFPECSKDCEKVKLLGAGECENICPEKFKEQSDHSKDNYGPGADNYGRDKPFWKEPQSLPKEETIKQQRRINEVIEALKVKILSRLDFTPESICANLDTFRDELLSMISKSHPQSKEEQPEISEEEIEEWAKLEHRGEMTQREHIERINGLIKGAKAMRDGSIAIWMRKQLNK